MFRQLINQLPLHSAGVTINRCRKLIRGMVKDPHSIRPPKQTAQLSMMSIRENNNKLLIGILVISKFLEKISQLQLKGGFKIIQPKANS
jgi:hypothetical protein